jgi:PAS domain S-box-containing protein
VYAGGVGADGGSRGERSASGRAGAEKAVTRRGQAIARLGTYTRAVRDNVLGLVGLGLVVLCAILCLAGWRLARERDVHATATRFHFPALVDLADIQRDAALLPAPGVRGRITAALTDLDRLQADGGEATYAPDLDRLEARWRELAGGGQGAGPPDVRLERFQAAVADLRHRHEVDARRASTWLDETDPWWGVTLGLPLLLLLGMGAAGGYRMFGRISRTALRQEALEEALRRTEAEHARAQALAHLGHWTLDLENGRSRRSAETYRILGHTPESLSASPDAFFTLVHPDDRDEVRERFAEAVASGGAFAAEFRIVRPDGEERAVFSRAEVVRNPDTGRPARMEGTFQDITERKALEGALREREAVLRQLTEAIDQVFWVEEPESRRVLYVSPAYESIWGRSCESVMENPKSWAEAIHPDDRADVERVLAHSRETGTAYQHVYRVVHPDGTERVIEGRGYPVRDERGRIYRWAGVSADITELHRLQDAHRESEERFQGIFDQSPVGIGMANLEGRVVEVNPALESLLGYTAEELKGGSFLDLSLPEDLDGYRELVDRVWAGEDVGPIDRRYLRKDGKVVWGRLSLGLMRDAEGRPRNTIGMVQDITERRAVEQALATSEALLRQLTDNIDQVFWLRDNASEAIHYLSPAFESIWGRPREPLYGAARGWMEAVLPEDVPAIQEALREAAEKEQPYQVTYRIRRPDGTERTIQARGFPVRDADGTVYRWAGVAADVSELLRLQDALKESEERLRQVTETIREVFWVGLPDTGGVLYVSAAYETLWGRSRQSLYENPRSWLDALHPDDRRRMAGTLARQLEGESEETFRIIRPDGEVRWIRNRSYPVRDAEGKVYRVVGSATDITDEKNAEISLREQEERTRLILDSAAEGIYGVDLDGHCTFANAASLRLLGYLSADDLLGRDMHEATQGAHEHAHAHGAHAQEAHAAHAAAGPTPVCELREAIRQGRRYHNPDSYVLRADGSPLAVDLWAYPVHRGDKLVGGVVTFVDVSERRRAEEERRRYQEELAHVARLSTLGEMTAGLAHELNQPLAAIANYAHGSISRLRQNGGADPGLLESLEQIAAQAARSGAIIRHLREFAGKGPGRRSLEDINALVASAARLIESEAREGKVSLHLDLAPGLPGVPVDRIQVDQVLINLMKNAVEALRESGGPRHLTLRTGRGADGGVEVIVADNGPGIPPACLDRLFHPFFTTKPDGLGLGLAISRSIIEAHGGSLGTVTHPGPGAAFRFTVPAEAAHA